jgi:hypothetical protein
MSTVADSQHCIYTSHTDIHNSPMLSFTPLTNLHPLILGINSPGLLRSITASPYFRREYHFLFTPTFSNTQLGHKTRAGVYMSPHNWGQMPKCPHHKQRKSLITYLSEFGEVSLKMPYLHCSE